MRKVILYMAVSIDGFIARSDGSVDWLDTEAEIGEEYALDTFLERVDTLIMGRKSYEQTLTFGPWAWPNHQTVVYSTSEIKPETPHTTVTSDPNLIDTLKKKEGKDIWLFGGGSLNHFFLEKDWIDEMMLFVQPSVLGAGIGLFGNQPAELKHFKRKGAHELGGGFTLLHYQK